MEWDVDPQIMYYSMLRLRNFRGFKKSKEIPLAPLTFLVGPNSSGKSSIFDAFLLLAQSRFDPSRIDIQRPRWGRKYVDLGSFTDAVYSHNPNLSIEIMTRVAFPSTPRRSSRPTGRSEMEICMGLRTKKNDRIGRLAYAKVVDVKTNQKIFIRYYPKHTTIELLDRLTSLELKEISHRDKNQRYEDKDRYFYHELRPFIRIIDEILASKPIILKGRKAAWNRIRDFSMFRTWPIFDNIELVASGRAAPRRWYSFEEMAGASRSSFPSAQIYRNVDPRMLVEPSIRFYPYHRRKKKVRLNLNIALKKLQIASSLTSSQLSAYHSTIDVKDNITGVTSNLIDVGYGASQVIPVIRACTSPSSGPLFVEQPEIHLHPRAQATLSEILCETSLDRQVIVETHSVHMINRARILVAEGKLPPEHVMINFVSRSASGSQVQPIPLLNNGDFATAWPVGYGFFDERYQDTLRLLSLKNISSER